MLAAWLFLSKEAWRPTVSVAHGNLVTPARPLPSLTLKTLDGSPFRLDQLRGRWTLFYVDAPLCDEICQVNLYNTRQIRLAVGEDTHRVQRVMVLTDTEQTEELEQLLRVHPDLIVVTADTPSLAALLSHFRIVDEDAVRTLQRVYILDPIGNLMMYYERDADAKGILKDLERLLKASQIG